MVWNQSAGLLLQQAIPVLTPSGYNLGSAAGEGTPEERSLLLCIARDEEERERETGVKSSPVSEQEGVFPLPFSKSLPFHSCQTGKHQHSAIETDREIPNF